MSDELLADEERRGLCARSSPFEAPAGLSAASPHRGQWPGEPPLEREAVILLDGRYRYVFRLEVARAIDDEARRVLDDTAKSARPLPLAGGGAAPCLVAEEPTVTGPWH